MKILQPCPTCGGPCEVVGAEHERRHKSSCDKLFAAVEALKEAREAMEAAMRIKDLWLIKSNQVNFIYQGEREALNSMLKKFESTLDKINKLTV